MAAEGGLDLWLKLLQIDRCYVLMDLSKDFVVLDLARVQLSTWQLQPRQMIFDFIERYKSSSETNLSFEGRFL